MKNIFTLIILVLSIDSISAKTNSDAELNAQILKDLELLHSIKQNQQSRAQGGMLLVGGDTNGCHFDNIQDAIDLASQGGVAEIRIATNKTYTENIIIDDFSITLIGGYISCFNAGLPGPLGGPGQNTVDIDGSSAALPALRITGNSQRHTIVLKNLGLKNGIGSGLQTGGGLNAYDANAQVLLDNVFISSNSGGGLAIVGGTTSNTDIVMVDTVVFSNTSSIVGGGIQCQASDASIVMGANSGITNNSISNPNGKGGGAYIVSGCTFSMYSSGMVGNNAKSDGGGLFVGDGSKVFLIGREVCNGSNCLGDNIRPVRFNANNADSDSSGQGNGGAIYITGASTFVDMSQVWVDDNTAFNGGAISVHEGAALSVDRFAQTCWNSHIDDKCNLFESNFASSTSGFGGAIYNDNSQILVNKTYLENNRADYGTAIYATGGSAASVIDGSIFNHNGNDGSGGYLDRYVIRATAGAEYLVLHSTFADNHATESVFGITSLLNSKLTLNRSIVHDSSTGDVLNANTGTTAFDCVLAHDINSMTATGTQLFFGDPEFIDRNNGNYHINASISSAVDMCASVFGGDDIETELRGWDDPSIPNQGNNVNAIFDAGADETYDNDVIFFNGFES